ncbi:MAG: hypothetical protein WA890_17130 [Micromonospora sp.]
MSQPPSNPYPGSYPPPQQQPGGYPPPQQPGPQYGGYPSAPQQPGPQYGGYPGGQPGQQYGGYPTEQQSPQYGGGYGSEQPASPYGYLETGQPQGSPAGPPPKKKSNLGRILLITLAVVVVLCLGGAAVLWFAAKDEVGDVVDATKTRVTTPATLGGRAKVTDPELTSAAEQMLTEMKKDVPDATSTAGGFYGDPAKKDLVMIAAASGVMANPKGELDTATKDLSTELTVKEFKTVEPGPLGGDARCGDGKADDVPVGVCVWADRGSLGVVITYFKSAADLQSEFVAMRGEIEQKS